MSCKRIRPLQTFYTFRSAVKERAFYWINFIYWRFSPEEKAAESAESFIDSISHVTSASQIFILSHLYNAITGFIRL
jgi:hypothetical protein